MARLLLDLEQTNDQELYAELSSTAYIQTIQEYSPRKLHRLMSSLAVGIVPHR
jgi:hypothetical protein